MHLIDRCCCTRICIRQNLDLRTKRAQLLGKMRKRIRDRWAESLEALIPLAFVAAEEVAWRFHVPQYVLLLTIFTCFI